MLLYLAAATALFAALPEPVFAQGGPGGGGPRPKMGGKKMPRGDKEPGPRQSADLDRFVLMSPQQRERALDRLPPERRHRIERGLEQYRSMNPEDRERLRKFQSMPEEQRDAVRQNFRRMRDLPPGRRAMVRREMQILRGLPESEREERMQSEGFLRRFDASEQNLIRDTAAILPPGEE
jgi:hypothetical protein